ncbi:hypothetical protein NL676_029708 [Syzygium grande]|nr:hypothetical protein NL676_029708 [Syzygium grande]
MEKQKDEKSEKDTQKQEEFSLQFAAQCPSSAHKGNNCNFANEANSVGVVIHPSFAVSLLSLDLNTSVLLLTKISTCLMELAAPTGGPRISFTVMDPSASSPVSYPVRPKRTDNHSSPRRRITVHLHIMYNRVHCSLTSLEHCRHVRCFSLRIKCIITPRRLVGRDSKDVESVPDFAKQAGGPPGRKMTRQTHQLVPSPSQRESDFGVPSDLSCRDRD